MEWFTNGSVLKTSLELSVRFGVGLKKIALNQTMNPLLNMLFYRNY